MVQNRYQDFRKRTRETVNTPESLADIIGEAEQVLAELDSELNRLFEQRRSVVGWTTRFLDLHWWIGEERLMLPADLEYKQVKGSEKGPLSSSVARQMVLLIADALTAARKEPEMDIVTDSDINDELHAQLAEGQVLPWRNPKAVIGTILNHNENWEIVSKGKYRYLGTMERLSNASIGAAPPPPAPAPADDVEELPW